VIEIQSNGLLHFQYFQEHLYPQRKESLLFCLNRLNF